MFKHVVVTGHTLKYGAWLPSALCGATFPGFRILTWGATFVRELIKQELSQEIKMKMVNVWEPQRTDSEDPDRNSAGIPKLTVCDLIPYSPSGGTGRHGRPTGIRIDKHREFNCFGIKPLWNPATIDCSPNTIPAEESDTIVYIFLDLAFGIPTFSDLLSGHPRYVVLYLTSTFPLDEQKTNRLVELIKFIRDSATRQGDSTPDSMVVITSASFLNYARFPLTDDCSWESFADNLRRCLQKPSDNMAQKLADAFRGLLLVVRHKADAVVELRVSNSLDKCRLHYLVSPDQHLIAAPGYLLGFNSILGASICGELSKTPTGSDAEVKEKLQDNLRAGIAQGIRRSAHFDATGFIRQPSPAQKESNANATAPELVAPPTTSEGPTKKEPDPGLFDESWHTNLFKRDVSSHVVHSIPAASDLAPHPISGQTWSVLSQLLNEGWSSPRIVDSV